MNLFTKNKKSKKNSIDDPKSRSPSPTKKSSAHRSNRDKDDSYRSPQGSPRRSGSSAPSQSYSPLFDPNTHPLNLPPDQLRRLSALSSMSEPVIADHMDVDGDVPMRNGAPSSPVQAAMPGSFEIPISSGTNAKTNGEAPPPPAHKSPPASPEAPPAPTPEDAEAFKTTGNKFYKAKEYKKAIEEYTKAVEAQPNSATYLSNRAAAYISNGQYAAALDDAIRANELEPNNPKILMRLARIYTNLGRPEESLAVWESIQPPPSAKDMAPAKAMLQHIKGAEEALKTSTSGSMALHALDQAERLQGLGAPRPRKWQLMRGEAYLKMGNVNALGDAQNVAMSLLRNNQSDPEALVLRGRALYAQGDNDKAIKHFRQALNCDPDFRDAVKYLRTVQKLDRLKEEGNKEYKSGRWQNAVEKYTEALEVDPLNKGTNSKILRNRAMCLVKLKEYTRAIADCDQALRLEPSYTNARKTKASALGESGNWEEAIKELKAIQESDPNDAGIAKEVRKAELELKKSKRKDYYKILGIEKDATEIEIKKAYRKQAALKHPDKRPGDESAVAEFQELSEAFETLSDPQKRERYDSGVDLMDPSDGFGGGMHGGGFGGGGIDPEMLFHMMGGMNGGGRQGGGGGFGGFPGGAQGFSQGGFNFQ